MRDRRSWLVLVLAIGLLLGCPGSGWSQVEVKTQLGWLRNGEFAPVMVADAKGFFAEEGIKHRILDRGPGKNPVPLVGAGQAHFGITAGGNAVFQARLAPDPVDIVAVGTLLQLGPYSYITLADRGAPDPRRRTSRARPSGSSPTATSSSRPWRRSTGST